MTDELEGDFITEFISNCAKTYAYTTNKGKQVVKCKVSHMKHHSSQVHVLRLLPRQTTKTREKTQTSLPRLDMVVVMGY